MNYRSILLLLFSCLCSFLYSQNKNSKTIQVYYSFSHIKDTTRPNIVYKENMVLLTNKDKSLYLSEYEFKTDSTFHENMAKVKAGISIDLPNEPIKFKYHTFESLLFVQQESKLYTIKPWTGDKIVIEEKWQHTNWELLDSTQNIEGLTCYSARGVVKGRTYTVWYCPDYPVSAGPWKIRGLPGLIVAADDASKTISFHLQSINNISYQIGLPEKTTKLSFHEYEQLMDNFKKNPMGYINAMNDSENSSNLQVTSTISFNKNSISNSGKLAKPKTSINNPLEIVQ